MYLTNKSDDRCAQSSYLGVLEDTNPWFFSDDSKLLWSILFLDKSQLIDFIISGEANKLAIVDCSPKKLINRVSRLTDSNSHEGSILKMREIVIAEKRVLVEKKVDALNQYREKLDNNPPRSQVLKSKAQKKLEELILAEKEASDDLDAYIKDDSFLAFDAKLLNMLRYLSDKYPDEKKR
ncbi:MAG: type I-Fv CRISPR-associated protein Cas5fv [Cypionkella sp.]|nr:type I-Fv CRISPR-associated protein Cas5fv [Cypionkella sp.]